MVRVLMGKFPIGTQMLPFNSKKSKKQLDTKLETFLSYYFFSPKTCHESGKKEFSVQIGPNSSLFTSWKDN
jgi:hypothetical protein